MMSNNLNKSVNRSANMNQSARQRREVKKLQKYDSNSIDEEEFQDCKFSIFYCFILFIL